MAAAPLDNLMLVNTASAVALAAACYFYGYWFSRARV